jgi:hypothetical protein
VWTELLDEKRNTHPYLFEHDPRNNVWSFVRTAIGGFNPVRFWRTLRPQMTIKPARLFWYWIICTSFSALLALSVFVAHIAADQIYPPFSPPSFLRVPAPRPLLADLIDGLANLAGPFSLTSAFIAIWTTSTFAALLVFQQSMLKARIRRVQVARCVAYCFDFGIWYALAGAALPILGVAGLDFGAAEFAFCVICFALLALAAGRLWAAYRLYLAFDHAFWVVLSSQIIAALALVTLLLNFQYPP